MNIFDKARAAIDKVETSFAKAKGSSGEKARDLSLEEIGETLASYTAPDDGEPEKVAQGENPDGSHLEELRVSASSERDSDRQEVDNEIEELERRIAALRAARQKRESDRRANEPSPQTQSSKTSEGHQADRPASLDSGGGDKPANEMAFFVICGLIFVLGLGVLWLFAVQDSQQDKGSSQTAITATSEPEELSQEGGGTGEQVNIAIDCKENWIFSTYDVVLYVDDAHVATLDHGKSESYEVRLESGRHTLRAESEEDASVDGSLSFDTSMYTDFRFIIRCENSQVELEEVPHVNMPFGSDDIDGMKVDDAKAALRDAGFTEIEIEESDDLESAQGALVDTLQSVSVDGERSISAGDEYYADADVLLTVHKMGDVHPPESAASLLGRDAHEVRDEFTSAGFTNVVIEEREADSSSDQLGVSAVTIGWLLFGNSNFTTTDTFDPAETVTIEMVVTRSSEPQNDGRDSEPTILTVENCPDLKELLSKSVDDASGFASSYWGETIQFDGYIADIQNHGDFDTRFDVLFLAGNVDTSPSVGPYFRFTDVSRWDMEYEGGILDAGKPVRITAVVDGWNDNGMWVDLDPVLLEDR